ncbi:branched-chain amino acid ABC transporter [Bacteroides sp. HF-5092]|nr:branched-chain amino acid ABC transporter [Bacteroides sp. HF-5092]
MSIGEVGNRLLFAKIGDKKISGSQSAGYRMNHFVEKGILFIAFWIMS